jgi:hypothetical protein
MYTQVNYQDPTFFEEECTLLTRRGDAELSFSIIIGLININQSHVFKNNQQLDELLSFKIHAFDKNAIQNGLISFLSNVGPRSKTILDLIEKKQYEFGLMDDSNFDRNHAKVRVYLDCIIESCHKMRELHEAYQSDLKFLMN